jgi:hypothetical protein
VFSSKNVLFEKLFVRNRNTFCSTLKLKFWKLWNRLIWICKCVHIILQHWHMPVHRYERMTTKLVKYWSVKKNKLQLQPFFSIDSRQTGRFGWTFPFTNSMYENLSTYVNKLINILMCWAMFFYLCTNWLIIQFQFLTKKSWTKKCSN